MIRRAPTERYSTAQRDLRRFWHRAEHLARQHKISLKLAARMVREDKRREQLVARGEVTFAQHAREIRRDVARAVRP